MEFGGVLFRSRVGVGCRRAARGQLPDREQCAIGGVRRRSRYRSVRGDAGEGRGPGGAPPRGGIAVVGSAGVSASTCGVLDLLRDDLRGFAGYRSARSEAVAGAIWLNANEAAYPNVVDGDGCLRRYPSPQPESLRCALADLYDCTPERLLIGRGSDEAIDLMVRAFCRPGVDAVLAP